MKNILLSLFVLTLYAFVSGCDKDSDDFNPYIELPCTFSDSAYNSIQAKYEYDNQGRLYKVISYNAGKPYLFTLFTITPNTLEESLYMIENGGDRLSSKKQYQLVDGLIKHYSTSDQAYERGVLCNTKTDDDYAYNSERKLLLKEWRYEARSVNTNKMIWFNDLKDSAVYQNGRLSEILRTETIIDSSGVVSVGHYMVNYVYEETSPSLKFIPYGNFGNYGPGPWWGNMPTDKLPLKIITTTDSSGIRVINMEQYFYTEYTENGKLKKVRYEMYAPFTYSPPRTWLYSHACP